MPKCVVEYDYQGRSTAGGYYEIVVTKFVATQLMPEVIHRITEPTMQGAYDKLGQLGFKIVS